MGEFGYFFEYKTDSILTLNNIDLAPFLHQKRQDILGLSCKSFFSLWKKEKIHINESISGDMQGLTENNIYITIEDKVHNTCDASDYYDIPVNTLFLLVSQRLNSPEGTTHRFIYLPMEYVKINIDLNKSLRNPIGRNYRKLLDFDETYPSLNNLLSKYDKVGMEDLIFPEPETIVTPLEHLLLTFKDIESNERIEMFGLKAPAQLMRPWGAL
ncbi:MAG: hypothetical protein QM500_04460 [Methylococcales bacterium]